MPKAIRIYEHGGPEVLKWEECDPGPVGDKDVRVRHTAIGLNFSDIYLRTGLYPQSLPSGMGSEAAGIVEAVGRRIRALKPGDRVAYTILGAPGAYAEQRVLPADALLRIPRGVTDEQAAAVLLKGLTAWFLLRETWPVQRGDAVLVPAAAGGVGLIISQWARTLGAKVIGVVSSEEKARLARRHGCNHVLVGYEDLGVRVRKLTRGQGVDVVYDGVGKDSFLASLDCLKPCALMVSFGNASGPVPPISPLELARRGSLYLTRPRSTDYLAMRGAMAAGARELFRLIRAKAVKVHVGQRYALAQAARAQRDLAARRTSGSTILVP